MSHGLELFGCDDVGADYGALLQTAGGLLSSGVDVYEQSEKEKKLASADRAKADAAIAADAAASSAVARAMVSAKVKSASASIDATAAQQATAAQDKAGAGLSQGASDKRAAAAEKALAGVTAQAQVKPTDAYLAALVAAWTATVNKAHAGGIVASDDFAPKGKGKDGEGGKSWWTRRVVGPIPGVGVVAIGAGVVGVLGIVVKKVFFK